MMTGGGGGNRVGVVESGERFTTSLSVCLQRISTAFRLAGAHSKSKRRRQKKGPSIWKPIC